MAGAALTDRIAASLGPLPPAALGIAVSGGGDSMALLHLLHDMADTRGLSLRAVTVDHGLRAGSAEEAAGVAACCAALGIPHDTLQWADWDGSGNLQAAARDARYRLMADWAARHDIGAIALGHTADDQAETFVMRLARRSGVDGLSAMAPHSVRAGIEWLRPLLGIHRAELRGYLRERGIDWVDDPGNEDPAFDRIRIRKALDTLAELGIGRDVLGEVAGHMRKARQALGWQTYLAARELVHLDAGSVVICERRLRTQPDEIQRRLMVAALGWVGGADYPPRRASVARVLEAVSQGRPCTVDGCQIRVIGGQIWVFREFAAVESQRGTPNGLWDSRWRLHASGGGGMGPLRVAALGPEGLQQCPEWRKSGRPREVLLSSPAVWRAEEVVAAPFANRPGQWHAEIDGGEDAFFAALLSH